MKNLRKSFLIIVIIQVKKKQIICESINNIIRFVIGDKKYLLENQEDLEEIKKLNMNNKTDYRCLEIRDKIIDE